MYMFPPVMFSFLIISLLSNFMAGIKTKKGPLKKRGFENKLLIITCPVQAIAIRF
jgi:hypothetical protein